MERWKKHFSLRIFFSESIAPRRTERWSLESAPPRRTRPGSLERARRALYAHIFCHLGEQDRGRLKVLVAHSTPIFFSSRCDQ
ncbi:hypothetical protein V1477_006443 [Vespula maculifrons]|uniref:Uncharacterized protein n=1 Tax=Vespula maculifrons TaxID=7453 RepID=A0ABD2CM99_VESMC